MALAAIYDGATRTEAARGWMATAVSGEAPRCRATTRKGETCRRTPLPRNGYCPSHQHLAETEDHEPALIAA